MAHPHSLQTAVLLRCMSKGTYRELKLPEQWRPLWFLNTLPLIFLCSLDVSNCRGNKLEKTLEAIHASKSIEVFSFSKSRKATDQINIVNKTVFL